MIVDLEELERRIGKIEEHIGMGEIQNMCDRCGRLASPLFIVYACSFREERYCFRCIAYIYIIGIKYWLLEKLFNVHVRRLIKVGNGWKAKLCGGMSKQDE